MSFLKEFKEFALKGNVIDLAVAVVIGAAFTAIISSLVEHVITPLLLQPALEKAGISELDKLAWGAVKYGLFLAAVMKFILIALVLFFMIKGINRLNRKKSAEAPAAAAPPELTLTEKLLVEIRDGLKK